MRELRRPRSGVYRLRNTVNGDAYVGSSADLHRREGDHMTCLRHGNHQSPRVRRCAKRYGAHKFVFEVLEYCPAQLLCERELAWINKLKPSLNSGKNTKRHVFVTRPQRNVALNLDGVKRLLAVGKSLPVPETQLSRLLDMAIAEFIQRRSK